MLFVTRIYGTRKLPKCMNTLNGLCFKLAGPPESIKSRLGFEGSVAGPAFCSQNSPTCPPADGKVKIVTRWSAVQDCYLRLTHF